MPFIELKVLLVAALLGLGFYYRRRRLPLLVEPTHRRARGILGVAGTLLLALGWLIIRGLLVSHGHLLASLSTAFVAFFGVPVLLMLGLSMIVVAIWFSFDSVISYLDFVTGEPKRSDD